MVGCGCRVMAVEIFFFGWVTSNSKRDYGEAATFLDRDCLEKQLDLRL
jgi:hypothetical protein